MVKITYNMILDEFIRSDNLCGSDRDISCHVCGQCVHEMDGFDIRQDLETHTIVVCNPCRLEEYPTRDEALVTALNSVYESWSESSSTEEDYWESVQSKSNLFPETVDGMLDINIQRSWYVTDHTPQKKTVTATVYPCYYETGEDNKKYQETDTTNPISKHLYTHKWNVWMKIKNMDEARKYGGK